MRQITTPRFILSSNKLHAGKSLTAIGLCVALRKRNIAIACGVVGANQLQATILKRLTRRYVRSLDLNLLTSSQVLATLEQLSIGADLIMLEGQQSLYDGVSPGSLKLSDAELAALTKTPVILLVDAEGYNSSIAALIKGFKDFAQGFKIEGVILNKSAAENPAEARDKIYFDCALQAFGMQSLTGNIPKIDIAIPDLSVKFSQQNVSISHPLQFYKDLGNLIEKHVDIDGLIEKAKGASALQLSDSGLIPMNRRTRIAVSEDSCFNLCFQDNIDLLRLYGAEIVAFSPLADEAIPKRVGALYLSGALLFDYAEELSKNNNMKTSIKNFVEGGGVLYSEGAGSAYLCEEYEAAEDGVFFEGIGIIKGKAVKQASAFAYNEAIIIEDSILGHCGQILKGVSLGEWKLQAKNPIPRTLRIADDAINSFEEGYSAEAQTFSTFTFPHFGSNPTIAKNIVDAAEIVAKI